MAITTASNAKRYWAPKFSPTRIWQFTPSINLPIFSAGLIAGQAKEAEAMEKAFKSAKLRYELGFISYTDMLTVEQSWLSARQQEIISKQNAITATINLYKALGGGWNNKDLPDLPSLAPAGR